MRWGRRAEAAASAATLPRTAIDLADVSHAYGDRPVLADVSVTLTERRVGVIGANGSGKSTFARLLNGLVLPSAGTVTVDALDTRTQGREVRRRVGFVFQDPDAQIVHPTVAEDAGYGLENQGVPADGSTSPVSSRANVLLPDPCAPMTPTRRSVRGTETSVRTGRSP